MVFLCWARPSPQEQKACIVKSGTFNYDSEHRGASSKPTSTLQEDKKLSRNGFLVNHARSLVGSGMDTYEKGKTALQNWRHFGLDWAFVDSKTPIQSGVKFCVCVKEIFPWLMMPLQVVYVNEHRNTRKGVASFGFGSGTLQGHLLNSNCPILSSLKPKKRRWSNKFCLSEAANGGKYVVQVGRIEDDDELWNRRMKCPEVQGQDRKL
ncbi:UPF0548 protein At2g17695 isoform X1 [Diospyros lotus]|uniref:UPF0548 protein At2g17695 isoform X1 n=1 Tax=Diospyros lotus TaxID=55363 RepID=UPI0022583135|nr:UPF0548 protein At2g17695 isoform X1 [Diospyros lotus]